MWIYVCHWRFYVENMLDTKMNRKFYLHFNIFVDKNENVFIEIFVMLLEVTNILRLVKKQMIWVGCEDSNVQVTFGTDWNSWKDYEEIKLKILSNKFEWL